MEKTELYIDGDSIVMLPEAPDCCCRINAIMHGVETTIYCDESGRIVYTENTDEQDMIESLVMMADNDSPRGQFTI